MNTEENQAMGTNKPEQEQKTFGMKAVGIDFNPSGDPTVNRLKMQSADFIDTCNELRSVVSKGEAARMYSLAITAMQEAQMWAVKAATWKD